MILTSAFQLWRVSHEQKNFKGIRNRVWKCLQDLKLKFLSQAGKEILLKVVIRAILTYCMSDFRLPKVLCSNINSLMQNVLVGGIPYPVDELEQAGRVEGKRFYGLLGPHML